MSQGQMRACHADSLHHRWLDVRGQSCQNPGAVASSPIGLHVGGKISAKTQSLLKHSILSLCHDRENYTWKATGSGNAIGKYIWFSISHL